VHKGSYPNNILPSYLEDFVPSCAIRIYIYNRVLIASFLRFWGIPKEQYDEATKLSIRLMDEIGVQQEIENEDDVSVLAASTSPEDNDMLRVAMCLSEASGDIDRKGNITGWLNELAFTPMDYNPDAPDDELLGDRGVGIQYFPQEYVFRLVPKVISNCR
jgi:hypothetical protein